jgi:hypothetical protein
MAAVGKVVRGNVSLGTRQSSLLGWRVGNVDRPNKRSRGGEVVPYRLAESPDTRPNCRKTGLNRNGAPRASYPAIVVTPKLRRSKLRVLHEACGSRAERPRSRTFAYQISEERKNVYRGRRDSIRAQEKDGIGPGSCAGGDATLLWHFSSSVGRKSVAPW